MKQIIFESITNFLEMSISCFFASGLFCKETREKKDACALILFVISGAVFLMLQEYIFTWIPDLAPAVIVFTLYAIIICKAKWWAAVSWALVNYLFIGIIVIITDYAFRVVLLPANETVRSAELIWLLSCALARIGQLLLSEIILLIWKKFPASHIRRGSWKTVVISSVSIVIIWILWVRRFDVDEDVLYSNSLVCLMVLAFNFSFLFFDEVLAREKQVEEELKTQNRLAALQMRNQDEVNNMYKSILSLKHDINNHLHTISGYMQVGEYAKAQEYVEEIAGEVSRIQSFHSGNTVMDALIGSKTALAEMNDIPVDVSLAVPSELKIADEHLTVMIGNLYDNAIDANLRIKDVNKRFIHIRITYDGGNLLFIFENAAVEEERTDSADAWSTTKEDRSMHGFGIKNIDKIVQMYGGYCERKLQEHVFCCRIRMPGK